MPLIEEFVRSGSWLFRWRSYLPLVLIGFFVVCLGHWRTEESFHATRWWEASCFLVSLFGFGVRAYTVAHVPAGTSGRATGHQRADSLNTTGAYSVVRHPLYVGNFFMWLGIALFPAVWWITLIFALAFCLYYERIMFAEEAFLREEFGEAYEEWASRTPAFIPDLRAFRSPELPFSFRTVLRREYNGIYAVVAVLVAFDVLGRWAARGEIIWDRAWLIAFCGSTLAWLMAMSSNRYTKWLSVEGR